VEVIMSWYIDAWAPYDGIAFASERSPADRDVLHTVHLAAPDFVPTPVASLSTALWATRGGFQEKFYDAAGEEVAFDTLEQLIHAVRRAFLGGGRGFPTPGGAGLPGAPPRSPAGPQEFPPDPATPREPPPAGWQELREELLRLRNGGDRSAVADAITAVLEQSFAAHIAPFLRQTVVAMIAALDGGEPARLAAVRNVTRWVEYLALAGTWQRSAVGTPLPSGFPEDPGLRNLADALLTGPYPWITMIEHIDATELGALLFAVPVPRQWQGKQVAQTLGEHLCVAAADIAAIGADTTFEEFVPLLAISKVLAGCALYPGFSIFRVPLLGETTHAEVVREAGRWLAQVVPGPELDGHTAETYISAMVSTPRPRPSGTPPP
jgi:hypothetical protein